MGFSVFLLLLIPNFILLWLEKILHIFLNLLRLNSWPKTWPILENDPSALEKSVYSIVVECSLCPSDLLVYCVKSPIFFFLHVFFLLVLTVIENRVSKSLSLKKRWFLPLVLSIFASSFLVVYCLVCRCL